jgi:hypothetical protein
MQKASDNMAGSLPLHGAEIAVGSLNKRYKLPDKVKWEVVALVNNLGMSQAGIGRNWLVLGRGHQRFHVPAWQVKRIMQLFRTFGDICTPKKFTMSRKQIPPDGSVIRAIRALVEHDCTLFIDEIQDALEEAHGRFSYDVVCRAMDFDGISHKMLSVTAAQRNYEERRRFRAEFMHGKIPVENLVFLDESHKRGMNRLRGWAKRGMQARIHAAFDQDTKYSLLAACWVGGFITDACWLVPEVGVNASIFGFWVRNYLIPNLRPGLLVVADNASIHHCALLEELLMEIGVYVVWNVPYSPDFNPIESGFNDDKSWIRRHQRAEGYQGMVVLTRRSLIEVSKNMPAHFQHCGYDVASWRQRTAEAQRAQQDFEAVVVCAAVAAVVVDATTDL